VRVRTFLSAMSRKSTTMDLIGKRRTNKIQEERKDRKTTREKKHSCTCRCCFCYFWPGHVAKYLPEKNMYREYRQEVCSSLFLFFHHYHVIKMNYISILFSLVLSVDKNNNSNQIILILFFHILDTQHCHLWHFISYFFLFLFFFLLLILTDLVNIYLCLCVFTEQVLSLVY